MTHLLIISGIITIWILFGIGAIRRWMGARISAYSWDGRESTRQIEQIFEGCWNGEEVDRAAAWHRTIVHLKNFDYSPVMVREAELRLYFLEHEHSERHYAVNRNGRVVKISVIKCKRKEL